MQPQEILKAIRSVIDKKPNEFEAQAEQVGAYNTKADGGG